MPPCDHSGLRLYLVLAVVLLLRGSWLALVRLTMAGGESYLHVLLLSLKFAPTSELLKAKDTLTPHDFPRHQRRDKYMRQTKSYHR